MDQAARVAFIQAQVVCALAEIEGMKAENAHYALCNGGAVKYGEEAFNSVPVRYGLDHNSVILYLRDG